MSRKKSKSVVHGATSWLYARAVHGHLDLVNFSVAFILGGAPDGELLDFTGDLAFAIDSPKQMLYARRCSFSKRRIVPALANPVGKSSRMMRRGATLT